MSDNQTKNPTASPNRAQPELTELNLLLQKLDQETDPARKAELKRQLEGMEQEIGEANSR